MAIQQGRLDVVGHRLVVRFENTGADPLTIEGFIVETPSLEPGLERTKPFELTPGDAIAIRLDLPASRCDTEPGPVVVRFDARTASGPRLSRRRITGSSLQERNTTSLMFRIRSVTSSLTPGIVSNSCSASSRRTWVIAAPGIDDSSVRRRLLPRV